VPIALLPGAASGRQEKDDMSPRTRTERRSGAVRAGGATAQAGGTTAAGDARLNQQMADALLEGAEARAARDAAASREDALSNERLRITLRALVAGRDA
jgi:hypothetical protein